MSRGYNQVAVRGDAFRVVLQRAIDQQGSGVRAMSSGDVYEASIADRLEAAGAMKVASARRRIWGIMNSETTVVSFDVADKILTALDLNHLWHTELKDAIVLPELKAPAERGPRYRARVEGKCSGCDAPYSERTRGCHQCASRHIWRRRRAKRAALKQAGLRFSADHTGVVHRQGGTDLEEAA